MILDYGIENLRALVQGRKLNALQMLLARNEFEQLVESKNELSKLHQPTVIDCVHPFEDVIVKEYGHYCTLCNCYIIEG